MTAPTRERLADLAAAERAAEADKAELDAQGEQARAERDAADRAAETQAQAAAGAQEEARAELESWLDAEPEADGRLMVCVYSEYNGDALTAEQIAELQAALAADVGEMAEADTEAEAD